MADNPPLSSAALTSQPAPQPSSVAPEFIYKNKLQEYIQKASLPFPVYQTVKEGPPHAPVFRSTVWVNGVQYLSSVFLQRKAAEQDAARVALTSIKPPLPLPQQTVKDDEESPDVRPFINEDTTFCKSILNEYSAKKRIEKPTYATVQSGGHIPVFSSNVVLDGITCSGFPGRTKKEAEQLAARAGVLTILDSENGKDMYEIVKCKFKMYATIHGLKETFTGSNAVPIVNGENRLDSDANKRKNDGVSPIIETTTTTTTTPLHEFKKPRVDDADMATALPHLITFVPAGSQTEEVPSISGVKKKKNKNKNKKKKAKKVQQGNNNQMSSTAVV